MTDGLSIVAASLRHVSGAGATPVAAAAGRAAAPAGQGPDFAAVLADVASGAAEKLHAGEAAAISGITGTASVQEVVQAVMSAEQTLQAAIAIRDKVVAAYQEISRMAI